MNDQSRRRKRVKGRNAHAPAAPVCSAAPSLCEFWAELQRANAAGTQPSSAAPAYAAASAAGVSSGRSSGGSCGLGYGLGLILPDAKSQQRVMDIMRELCEKDAARLRGQEAQNR